MKVSVIGCGYLGAVHAACLAASGHDVVGLDTDLAKVELLSGGVPPFYEPGLEELLTTALETGRLRFTTDPAAVQGAQVHFVCVGTPQRAQDYGADLTYVDDAVTRLVPYLAEGDLVVGKSTVPVGTAARLSRQISEGSGASLAWNPEFLREGYAVKDTLHPDRIVYGVPSSTETDPAVLLLDKVYAGQLAEHTPRIVTDYATAELVKVAANSFLATKVSFINAMAELCEATGADVVQLADAIGHDERIGRRYLGAGLGFGGGCLPKDIRAFIARAHELGADPAVSFLKEVDSINLRRRARMVELTEEVCGGSVRGMRIAVLGAAFKPDSDDVRDSPALDVAAALKDLGADVVVTDPRALANVRRVRSDLTLVDTVTEAATGADVVLLLTEWREYREIDPEKLGSIVAQRRMLDGRNALEPQVWRAAGWSYRALGRP